MPDPTFLDKLCTRADLAARVAALPQPVVLTNGVFDILHRGQVSYLAQARALGGSLALGLNSDVSARRLGKGPGRPLNAELDRACVLAALESDSLVTLFDEATPVAMTDANARPVWGTDYAPFGQRLTPMAPALVKISAPGHATLAGVEGIRLDLRLPGQREDRDTGLYYNDPRSGRYMNPDPSGLSG